MFGQPHQHFAEIDSTNRVALEWEDAPHGAIVTADAQSAGRGRLGRVWNSPAGKGLYLSLVLRQNVPQNPSLLSVLGVAEAVEALTALKVQTKWPNDVLCRGFKIGGILCEVRGDRTVVGIGLNLNHESDDLPPRPLFPASSLLLLAGRRWQVENVLPILLAHLEDVFSSDWETQRARYEARLYGQGELARVGSLLGLVAGVDDEGRLLLQTSDGKQPVLAGDVEFV
jgi:BirA family transcriptional regulator, biotin operon repressor / biotin---[acetyl-CoA-carboxylase] ligase